MGTSLAVFVVAPAFAQPSALTFTNSARCDVSARVTGTIKPNSDGVGGKAHLAVRTTYDLTEGSSKPRRGASDRAIGSNDSGEFE
ncbi:MAG: hypothetical protein EON58_01935 [Alphaproteobacteria bacterium]|nr:MAG: hypothetical protein EON58_01935 [Alphaproteobacteria bacterium]